MSQIRSKSNSIIEKHEKAESLMVGMQVSFKLFFMAQNFKYSIYLKYLIVLIVKKHFIIKNKNIGDD